MRNKKMAKGNNKIMTVRRVFVLRFFMDFIIFLLILQTCSLVQTNEVQNVEIKDEKLMNKSSDINVTTIVPDRTKFILSNISQVLFNDEDILSELYDEDIWMKRFSTDNYELATTQIIDQRNITEEKGQDILRNSHENNHFNGNIFLKENENLTTFMNLIPLVPINDEKNTSNQWATIIVNRNKTQLDNYDMKNNSKHLTSSLYHSLISNAWTSYLEPLIQMAVAKSKLNAATNGTKSAGKKNFDHMKIEEHQDRLPTKFYNQTHNVTAIAAKILLETHTELTTINTTTSNNSDVTLRSIFPDLPTPQSIHSQIHNASDTIENVTIIYDSNIRMTYTTKSQPINDSLIFEIDTTAPSSMETIINGKPESPNYIQNIKNDTIGSLIKSNNNNINVNEESIFTKTMSQDYNNSKIRPPYSARYSQINNSTLNDRQIEKREIGLNSDYNTVQRQELASYFYNDQKIRENYPTYAKPPADDDNFSSNIYNTDDITGSTGLDVYPFQTFYVSNLDDSPFKESIDENVNVNSNITQNFRTDINDSSSLYFADKFGYSIINDIVTMPTTTKITTENKTIYSRKISPTSSRITEDKRKRVSAQKNSTRNRIVHKSKSNSGRKRKSKMRRTQKSKKNGRKLSVKLGKRGNSKKRKSKSSKYSRNRSNYRSKSNTLKKKRKASMRKSSGRKNPKQNRKRNNQHTREE